ncbi:MAG TPA: holo-ACP synthase [Thermomicrobiaceae bacterium]|nr:holo-ACP synthase [Thermomicrobiaceae bacterium]
MIEGIDIRVGVDLVSVQRITDIVERRGARFLTDHFSAAERRQLEAVANGRLETLSGRVGAKEALIKMLAPEDQMVPWRDIEVLAQGGRAPAARLSGAAAELAQARGLGSVDISISHEGLWAVAVAVGVFGSPGRDTKGWDR